MLRAYLTLYCLLLVLDPIRYMQLYFHKVGWLFTPCKVLSKYTKKNTSASLSLWNLWNDWDPSLWPGTSKPLDTTFLDVKIGEQC